MELAFEAKALRSICESEAEAKRALGCRVAETLKHRLADLRAATSVEDLVAGQPRNLGGDDLHHMAVDLSDVCRMVFCANHARNPTTDAGDIDWSRVSRVKILRIEEDNA